MTTQLSDRKIQRCRITVHGLVQGMGFRPFVYRLAKELGLTGRVGNTAEGVVIDIEGEEAGLAQFLNKVQNEAPVHSRVDSMQTQYLKPKRYPDFHIQHRGDGAAPKTALVLPDMATCRECQEEIFNPRNRRYLYPFTNCTHCGPRYSIIEGIPYDRANTSMKNFAMCADCQAEYDDPDDRRFHAQPNACFHCGPHLELWEANGKILDTHHHALKVASHAIKAGKIVAVKGIGGFHLFCDARNEKNVRLLRARKHREGKPFALMFPGYGMIETACDVSELEKSLLASSEAPIVLLKKKNGCALITEAVAPDNSFLGVMLPYSPLHHILTRELAVPAVATSGNIADEPICTDEQEAVQRLSGIADLFLIHNRPIVRSVDDSLVMVMAGRPCLLRRARGYAPLPFPMETDGPVGLAVGGHLKNTVAISARRQIFLSQHIGDLETPQSYAAFRHTLKSLQNLYGAKPDYVVHDLHPDYFSTKFAATLDIPRIEVQHHHAHIAACMAEHNIRGPVLGIAWDGTGLGTDRTVWGGEFLMADLGNFQRIGHLKPFPLPGGEKAIQEPRRAALGLLSQLDESFLNRGDLPALKAFAPGDLKIIQSMLARGFNSPLTSAMGRLFDAVASLLGLCHFNRFEGEAAVKLEFLAGQCDTQARYPYQIASRSGPMVLDWSFMIKQIIDEVRSRASRALISAKFHNTLVAMGVDAAQRAGEPRVVLSGGCFQNRYLTEKLIARLQAAGFTPYWHQQVPPNDGGLALGQAVIGLNRIQKGG